MCWTASARLKPARIVGVVRTGRQTVAAAFAPHPTAVQHMPLGTGDAAKAALPRTRRAMRGPVLVVYADVAAGDDGDACSGWSRPAARRKAAGRRAGLHARAIRRPTAG